MAEGGGGSQDVLNLAQAGSILFGGSSSGAGSQSGTTRGSTTEQLVLDQAAIEKIIADVLGGPQGLASIFGGEQTAGVFDSSVAAQAAGDLASSLVGELAKLTGKKSTEQEVETKSTSEQSAESEGLIETIGKFIGL